MSAPYAFGIRDKLRLAGVRLCDHTLNSVAVLGANQQRFGCEAPPPLSSCHITFMMAAPMFEDDMLLTYTRSFWLVRYLESIRGWHDRHEYAMTILRGHHSRRVRQKIVKHLSRNMSPDQLLCGMKTGRKAKPVIILRDRPRYRQLTLHEAWGLWE